VEFGLKWALIDEGTLLYQSPPDAIFALSLSLSLCLSVCATAWLAGCICEYLFAQRAESNCAAVRDVFFPSAAAEAAFALETRLKRSRQASRPTPPARPPLPFSNSFAVMPPSFDTAQVFVRGDVISGPNEPSNERFIFGEDCNTLVLL